MKSVQELVWKRMRDEVRQVDRRVNRISVRSQQTQTARGVPASTLANAPRAADGGLSDGSEYIDLLWISNGRKPNEGAGNGSGVLAIYDAGQDAWLRVGDYAVVQT